MTVSLFLDSLATQHREVQRHESSKFKTYFGAVTYLQGGFESGFHHVEEEEPTTRLLRVHRPSALQGTRTQNGVAISQVPLQADSLNAHAVFILDTVDVVYSWQGAQSRGIEKAKAAEFITQLISERNGRGEMVVIEQNTGGQKAFWDALGTAADEPVNQITDDNDDEDDLNETIQQDREHRLLRLHAGMLGKLKLDTVAQGKINKGMFDSKDVFILDVSHEIFVWVGSEASRKERRYGLQYAQDYLKESGLSPFTPICQLQEGAEDELFEAQLEGWQGW
ncbi:unnamed protein product [Absidia cylindrospora]